MSKPIVIGGNGYRWRGKKIRTIQKGGVTCLTMPRIDSIVMAPCAVVSGKTYKVSIAGYRTSGNGALLINFFGGRNYDGPHIPVNITGTQPKLYTVSVPAPKFPKNLQMCLRIWKPNDSSGNVNIINIQYGETADNHRMVKTPALPQVSSGRVVRRPKPRPKPKPEPKLKEKKKKKPPKAQKVKEDKTMKFKPYTPKSTERADLVLIKEASDVPKVSIITPTRDGFENIKACYESMNANTSYPNWEWIIGDSASSDDTISYLKELNDPRIKIVERGTNEGSFSSINNELTKYADGEYFLFLNDDTEPQPFWLFEMMSKIHRRLDVGIVGAKLLYSKDKIQHAGICFVPEGPANMGKSVLKLFPKKFASHDRYLQAVTGACLLIRKKDFEAVGGFDPVYYFCYEDVDLCLKIRSQLRKKVLYAANAKLIHKESVTQNKHRTSGEKQQEGIRVFKDRWMRQVNIDFSTLKNNINTDVLKTDVSFVTCVNNITQYRNYVIGSLFRNNSKRNYEIIPIMNFGNKYSAAEALNIGIKRAKGEIIVLCHQDVLFYQNWIDTLFKRIKEVESKSKKWGVLGTAGISKRDDTVGVVHNTKGKLQWQSSKKATTYPVQTVDEHCMIIRKSSSLLFDQTHFNGFHFYGPDLCLEALSRSMSNYGILCPLVHDSSSGSLISGKQEFMRLLNELAKKWRQRFPFIRTPTSVIRRRSVRTFVRFSQ
jgi:GT2 family glycosyltransferase